jgi:hypothetical protein
MQTRISHLRELELLIPNISLQSHVSLTHPICQVVKVQLHPYNIVLEQVTYMTNFF